MNKKTSKLTILGTNIKGFPKTPHKAKLEAFNNSHKTTDYQVRLECPEFTSLCPKTHQPDFGKIVIEYIPDKKCIETKSLKLYLFSFRIVGIFVEDVVNEILKKIVKASKPKQATVRGEFNPRGGIAMSVEANYKRKRKKR